MLASTRGATARHVSFERKRGVQRVTVSPDVAHLTVAAASTETCSADIGRVFSVVGDAGIPIFLIQLHSLAVSFSVERADEERAVSTVRGAGYACTHRSDLAILQVFASGMRELEGILVDIADALQEAGARIYGMGDSHDQVQCLIEAAAADAAVERLKLRFGLEDEVA
ncbi:MAG TPA: hypothetical protein VLH79_15705 [Chthonomonadales bacterium]|nr:hypothetical protein [Chthonomonadales bacterium]